MLRFIFLVSLVAVLAACGTQGTTTPPEGNPDPRPLVELVTVDTVNVEIQESQPVQVVAHVIGSMPNGCYSLGEVRQERFDNTIELTVQMKNSGAEVCTMNIPGVDTRVTLDGDFPSGDYVLRVNGQVYNFSV
jgi:hypothetical protein